MHIAMFDINFSAMTHFVRCSFEKYKLVMLQLHARAAEIASESAISDQMSIYAERHDKRTSEIILILLVRLTNSTVKEILTNGFLFRLNLFVRYDTYRIIIDRIS